MMRIHYLEIVTGDVDGMCAYHPASRDAARAGE